MLIGFLTYWATTLWFTRDTIYEAAPENTAVAVRFFTGGSKEAQVSALLENSPLVSNRTLTFSDLKPYIQGEFVLFSKSNGAQSVAIRTRNSDSLPQTLLDSEHISQKLISKNIILLSEHAETTKKFPLKAKIFPTLSWLGKTWIGEIAFQDSQDRGLIFNTKNKLDISLPSKTPTLDFQGIPEKTFAFSSAKISGANETSSDSILNPFLPLIGPVLDENFKTYLEHLGNQSVKSFLTKDDAGIGFLLIIKQAPGQSDLDIPKMLQSLNALNTPKILKTSLPDGTFIQEIISDPNSVSVEQVTILGLQMNRIVTNQQEILAGITQDNELILTNREELLRFYRGKNPSGKAHSICSGNIAGMDIHQMDDLSKMHATFAEATPFSKISQHFSSLGIASGLISTHIYLCK